MDLIPSRLVLGWTLAGAPAANLGPWTSTIGPAGFVDLLATWLGVPTCRSSDAARIAACQAILWQGDRHAFWSASLKRDPWSTAKAVLELRDALWLAGWDGTAGADAPPRVADLAHLSDTFPKGEADILAVIPAALSARGGGGLPMLVLAEPARLWPFAWRRVFNALLSQGVTIEDLPQPIAKGVTDLGGLSASMRGDGPANWRADGSLLLLASESEIEADDVMSSWLSAGGDDIAVVKQAGGLLDAFLRSRHLPRLGEHSATGGLLPLALAVRWEPFDPTAALEFLSLPRMPLGRAARRLSAAIVESPGHGGPAFESAIRQAVMDRLRRLRDDGVTRAKRKRQARALIADISFWLPAQRYSRNEGLPAAEALTVCERVVAWSQRQKDPATGAAAAALADAINALGQEILAPALVGRMLEAVADVGAAPSHAEAAPWLLATAPGALLAPVRTVLWWLTDAASAVPPPWRATERSWMSAIGLEPDTAATRRGRERAALLRTVCAATDRLVLVRPRTVNGEVAVAHPLLADIEACFGGFPQGAWNEAGPLRDGGTLAGRDLPTIAAVPLAPPAPLRLWTVPKGGVAARDVESASGMEALLGCKLAWGLRYAAKLRSDGPAMLPDTDRLTGRFLHRILQLLFENRSVEPERAEGNARALFDRLLSQEAAPLLQLGQETRRARALHLLVQAVVVLKQRLAGSGLTVESVERTLRRPLPWGGVLEGRLDLLLQRPADGLRLVLDAKWTRSGKRYRESLALDRSVQLSAYAWLAEVLGQPVTAGYFLIRQARLHTAQAEPIAGAAVDGADLPRTWVRVLRSYAAALDEVKEGHLVAAGVASSPSGEPADDDDDRLEVAPPCGWCDYRALCGASKKGR